MRSPIGVFDSGLGGLSVVARLMDVLPNERVLYFADNAHVPYGERPLEQIKCFALGIVDFLIGKGAKAIVMACNMSSAIALKDACAPRPDIPILGVIEPGAKAAVGVADGKPIGVMATTGTVRSGAYVEAIKSLGFASGVVQKACPKFVPLVESGKAESEEAEAAACEYAAPLKKAGCETVILGCTHYPFLRNAIRYAVGDSMHIVDPAEETARILRSVLVEKGLVSDALESPHSFYSSGDTDGFAALGGAFLGRKIDAVQQAIWGVDLGATLKDAVV